MVLVRPVRLGIRYHRLNGYDERMSVSVAVSSCLQIGNVLLRVLRHLDKLLVLENVNEVPS